MHKKVSKFDNLFQMKIVNFCKDGIEGNIFIEIAVNVVHCLWELYLV